MNVDLDKYSEIKEKRLLRVCWFTLNLLLFPLLSKDGRNRLLRVFGAKIGLRCRIYRSVKIYAPWHLRLGDFVCIGPHVEIYNKAEVKIGSQVVVSQDAYMCTASHNISSPEMALTKAPIMVEDNVWVAAKANILPGVTISEGAVVGACAVVAKDVPPWSVVVGNPARVVKKRVLVGE